MSDKILITGPAISPDKADELGSLGFEVINGTEAAFEVLSVPSANRGRDLTESEMVALLQETSIYIYGGLEVASGSVLEHAPKLRLIAFMGTGWSDEGCIDAGAAERLKIAVTNTPGANSPSVAELAIASILALQRQIVFLNNRTKRGEGRPTKLRDISGRSLGIVGLGNIGSLVARHAVKGFGMDVVYAGPHPKAALEEELGIRRVPLDELLKQCEFVTLHCPARTTVGLIGSREISLMRQNAYLVNLSSPEVVSGMAITEALENGVIAGAAFDGWYKEPADLRERFLSLADDKLIVLPRTAWLTEDSYTRMIQMTLTNIRAQLRGERPPNQVNL
jgi:lactate dehydrogenase-like 2-hydroxyacid dehydrogenase